MTTSTAIQKWNELVLLAIQEGMKVRLVSSKLLDDFVGMNYVIGQQLGYMLPEGEIWISSSLPWPVRYHTLKHELIEVPMLLQGLPYKEAHKLALAGE